MLGVSRILEDIVYNRMKDGKGSTYTLDITFTQSDSGTEVKPTRLEAMSIEQLFSGQAVDNINCRCMFFPLDLYNLLNNTQDLKMTMIQQRWERKYYSTMPNEEPDVYTFKVMIENPQDLMKQIPPSALKKTAETDFERTQLHTPLPLDMQLIPDIDYEAMKQKGNAMLADTDVQSVILYMANLWGIQNTYLSPPDNTKKYENITIPPITGFNELIPMLQQQYGIYEKGAASYYCNGTWYIYPPYDTTPEKQEILNIFKLPENSVDGGDVYHVQDEDSLYIVSFSPVQTQNTAQSATENQGNAIAVRQADSSMDASRDVDNSGKVTLNQQAAVMAKVNSSSTTTKDQVSTDYRGTTANIFEGLSAISSGQMEHVGLGWIHAKPWSIIPGMKCIMHYDDTTKGTAEEDYYSTVPGIVDGVQYTLHPQGKPGELIYRWDAQIALSVAALETDASQTQSPTPKQ